MTFTYNLTDSIGQVRLLIPDRIADGAIFSDEEISAFLVAEGGVPKLAAALALETIAADEALVQKVQTTGDESTDGARLMDSLMRKAAALRAQARTEASGSETVGIGPGSSGARIRAAW